MRRITFLLGFYCILHATVFSQTVTILESAGWLESAYVKWSPAANASSYNVYYSGQGIVNKKIDTQLIRNYGTYFRADVLGLAAGNYSVKVVPVVNGSEGTAAETSSLTVEAQDRNGFAFTNNRMPGAYKADGTAKDNAVVLYVTEANKNSISCVVTGATTNPCVGIQTILDGIKKGRDNRPFIIRMIGQVKDASYLLNGDMVIENANNQLSYITFEGVGDDAVADGWGVRIKGASNVEIRNIGFMNCDSGEGDNVSLQQDNDYIWVHNCDLFYGAAGSDADQIKGDGAMDCKKSTYVTFSYNHFWDSGKSNLLGLSEGTTQGLYITYHHNWYDHSDSRHPRIRYYSAHVYNNYYDGNSKYGVGSTMGSSVFVENNYFRNCKYPMMTSMQGTDVFGGSAGTFSGEDGGSIKSFNNTMSGQTRYVVYLAVSNPVEFDAIEAITRSEVITADVKSKLGANTYNNFDTDIALYVKNLVPDQPEIAKNKTIQYAGRVNGGDLKWTFNNAVDDISYAVNAELKTALTTYTTKLVSVQGEGSANNGSQTLNVTGNATQTVQNGSAIADIVFTWGGDATDATVSGLLNTGLIITKNVSAKTITISGMPTTNANYTVTTSGTSGTPSILSGTITVTTGNIGGEMIHNFTLSGKTSTFFTITGNLSTSYGTVNYSGLSLTQCLKMESSTNISFSTTTSGTITLVFNSAYAGTVTIDGTSYSQNAGVISANVGAGQHTILKGSGASYLFYMSFNPLNATELVNVKSIQVYPNPVLDKLYLKGFSTPVQVEIYNVNGQKIHTNHYSNNCINVSALTSGIYLVQILSNTKKESFRILKQ